MRHFIRPSVLVPQGFVVDATDSTATETILVVRHTSIPVIAPVAALGRSGSIVATGDD